MHAVDGQQLLRHHDRFHRLDAFRQDTLANGPSNAHEPRPLGFQPAIEGRVEPAQVLKQDMLEAAEQLRRYLRRLSEQQRVDVQALSAQCQMVPVRDEKPRPGRT